MSDILEISDNLKIKGFLMTLDTEKYFYKHAYANGTTLFFKDEKSVMELMKTFDIFSTFSGLKPSKSKCEIADLGALKGVQLTLCGIKFIDLMFNAIKMLGVYYSYDKNLGKQEIFINLVLKIKNF